MSRFLVALLSLSFLLPLAAQELVSPAGNDTIVKTPNQTERMRLKPNGQVAIGTTGSQAQLEIADTAHAPRIHLSGTEYYQSQFASTSGIGIYLGVNRTDNRQLWFGDSASTTSPRFRMMFYPGYSSMDAVSPDGNTALPLAVGVHGQVFLAPGTGKITVGSFAQNPAYKLYVVGNTHIEGTLSGTSVKATYQDVAEWVPATDDLAPGTVVVLNPEHNNEVMASSRAYDTRVAGVVSPQPGITLGEGGADKETVATMGRVRVRVDATAGPIGIGDLLVTSGASGMAMKSMPVEMMGVEMHGPGTILGKALESLSGGTGEILVLLSMQ